MVIPLNQNSGTLSVVSKIVPNIQKVDQNSAESANNRTAYDQKAGSGNERNSTQEEALEVKVVSSEGRGRYTLEAAGVRVQVESRTPLIVGQQLQVQIYQGVKGLFLEVQNTDASQFLTRALAQGGSSQALATLFGQGLGRLAEQSNSTAASVSERNDPTKTEGSNVVKDKAQVVVNEIVNLQRQFIVKSNAGTAPVLPLVNPLTPSQSEQVIQRFTARLEQAMVPLLSAGQNKEALQQFTAALQGLSLFFSGSTTNNATIHKVTPAQQLLYDAITTSSVERSSIEQIAVKLFKQLSLQATVQRFQSGQLLENTGVGVSSKQPEAVVKSFGELFDSISSLLKTEKSPELSILFGEQSSGQLRFGNFVQNSISSQAQPFAKFFFQQLQAVGSVSYQQKQIPEVVGEKASRVNVASLSGVESSAFFVNEGGVDTSAGNILRQLVQGLGLDMEKLLLKGDTENAAKGLKYQLNQLRHQLVEENQTVRESLVVGDSIKKLGEVHQSLQSLDFIQVLQANLQKESALVLPLPLPFLEQGYLIFEEYGKEQERDSEDIGTKRFSLLLKLSSLGNMQIDLLQNREQIYIRFHTETEQISNFLQLFDHEIPPNLAPFAVQPPSYDTKRAEEPLTALLRRCSNDDGEHSLFSTKA